ncbi:MAG TPA: hypothetical protein VHP31_02470 [Caproicibacter sp.]|nr:hypothetical protein [Caproicibacter sp.]
MDENKAWEFFSHTGKIRDYLVYSQCRANHEKAQSQEDRYEDGRPGPGGFGEIRG